LLSPVVTGRQALVTALLKAATAWARKPPRESFELAPQQPVKRRALRPEPPAASKAWVRSMELSVVWADRLKLELFGVESVTAGMTPAAARGLATQQPKASEVLAGLPAVREPAWASPPARAISWPGLPPHPLSSAAAAGY
jgi:hypothetical protein